MFRNVAALVSVTLSLTTIATAGDAELLRVYDPSRGHEDSRLSRPADVDHPAGFSPDFKDKAAWDQRAEALRRRAVVAEGLWPTPEKTPLNAVVHGRIERDGYTVEKVFFASTPGHYVSGNLYRPTGKPQDHPAAKNGKLPGVLCPHGHWEGGRLMWNSDDVCRKQIETGAEKTTEGARSPLQARCAMLARMGCVVFHYDMVGYADSQKITHREGFKDAEAVLRLQSFMGLQTWNSVRSLDFLLMLPEVDPTRIGVTGASGGGTQTFILGAVDDRPAALFPAVMVSMNMQGGCVCENAPLLRVGTNNVELAATFAPKPLGASAANDWTIDLETRGLPELKSIYSLYGAADRVTAKHFSFPHNYNQVSREMMYDFFNRRLNLGQPSPVVEKPFEAVPPKELSVYDEQHPLPPDALDAANLRKSMAAASDAQLAALEKDPAEYAKVLRAVLGAMVCDVMPGKDDVLAGRLGGPRRAEALVIEKGFVRRKGTGEEVPVAALFPPNWEGTVVVWAHPGGKASLLDNDGKPAPLVRKLLDAKAAVVAADLYLAGEARPAGGKVPPVDAKYPGFTFGYNRSVLADRVHDLLTVIALARGWDETKSVRLIGFEKFGPVALFARELAGDALDRAAVELDGFDFDQVHDSSDEMMLPGATKYGGVYGFVPLCTHGETLIAHARKAGKWNLAGGVKGVTLREETSAPAELVEWLLR